MDARVIDWLYQHRHVPLTVRGQPPLKAVPVHSQKVETSYFIALSSSLLLAPCRYWKGKKRTSHKITQTFDDGCFLQKNAQTYKILLFVLSWQLFLNEFSSPNFSPILLIWKRKIVVNWDLANNFYPKRDMISFKESACYISVLIILLFFFLNQDQVGFASSLLAIFLPIT